MKPEIAAQILALNRQFYQTFALQFSATRMRLQPGVQRILELLPSEANILDLGCGNGELARALARRSHQGVYIGLDFSLELLEEANKVSLEPLNAEFYSTDLSAPDWLAFSEKSPRLTIPLPAAYDVITAFAVIHHLPGHKLRRDLLRQVRGCLAPGGRFFHSEWQFLNSPRLCERIQPWDRVELSESDLDAGDYLMDWRSGGNGLRYVHHFSEDELATLADEAGFTVERTFYSDGEGDRLGLYQVWRER